MRPDDICRDDVFGGRRKEDDNRIIPASLVHDTSSELRTLQELCDFIRDVNTYAQAGSSIEIGYGI